MILRVLLVVLIALASVTSAKAQVASGKQVVSDVGQWPVLSEGSTTARSMASRLGVLADVRDYGAKGDGVTDDTAAFTAVAAKTAVYVSAGTYVLTANVSLTGHLWVDPGAQLQIAATKTFTVGGGFTGPLARVFTGSGSALFSGSKVPVVYPQWFGNVCTGSDDVTAFTAAKNAAYAVGASLVVTCKIRLDSGATSVAAPIDFQGSGSLDVRTGASITISTFHAPLDQIFYLNGGTLSFVAKKQREIYPQYWGAKCDGSTNDADAFAAAAYAAGYLGIELNVSCKVRLDSGTTTANSINFTGNGSLDLRAGSTVTISGTISGPWKLQIFYLSGGTLNVVSNKTPKFTPLWFGAKCDGVTDDTASIQAAINAAANNELEFPNGGDCIIMDPLYVKSYSTYSAQGGAAVIKAGAGANIIYVSDPNPGALLQGYNVHHVTIKGLTLDVNYPASGSWGGVALLEGYDNVVDNNYIHDTGQCCVWLGDNNRPTVKNNRLVNCGMLSPGISMDHAIAVVTFHTEVHDVLLENNYLENVGRKGVGIASFDTGQLIDVRILHNKTKKVGLGGLFLAAAIPALPIKNILIEGNVSFEDDYVSITLNNADGGAIVDNLSYASVGSSAIYTDYVRNLNITGNTLVASDGYGISVGCIVGNSYGVSITDNTIINPNQASGPVGSGIGISTGATKIFMSNNYIQSYDGKMVYGIADTGDYNRIWVNYILGASVQTVIFTGSNTVSSNIFEPYDTVTSVILQGTGPITGGADFADVIARGKNTRISGYNFCTQNGTGGSNKFCVGYNGRAYYAVAGESLWMLGYRDASYSGTSADFKFGSRLIRTAGWVAAAVNQETDVTRISYQGHIQLSVGASSMPACDATNGPLIRGMIAYVGGGAGVADQAKICVKNVGDVYGWQTLY